MAGRYRIKRVLGEGAMGSVFLAEQDAAPRRVALKVLKRHLSADPYMVRRFRREAKAASRIDDPRTVAIYDFGEEDGELFLVMEFVEGHTLGAQLEVGPLAEADALNIIIEICGALESAHAAGIAHRDLKPENIMLTRDGIKILDFGIARLDASGAGVAESHLTVTGALLGTPLYMSPEAAGRRERVDAPADLYALGVILFEMLTGRPLFEDEEMVIILGMHLKMTPDTLADATGREFPEELESLVAALLRKQPAERPTASEALEVLRRIRGARGFDAEQTVETPLPWTPGLPDYDLPEFDVVTDVPTTVRAPVRAVATDAPSRTGRLPLLIGGATVAALGLAAAVLVAIGVASTADSEPAQTAPAGPPAQTAASAGDRVAPPRSRPVDEPVEATSDSVVQRTDVRVVGLPQGARLTLDGQPSEPQFTVPRDGRTHELRATSGGHRPAVRRFAGEGQSLEIEMNLRRRAGRRHRRRATRPPTTDVEAPSAGESTRPRTPQRRGAASRRSRAVQDLSGWQD